MAKDFSKVEVPKDEPREESTVVEVDPDSVPEPDSTTKAKAYRYNGVADRKQIRRSDFEDRGVNDQDTLVWEARNGWKVKTDGLSDDVLEILERDPNLVRVE